MDEIFWVFLRLGLLGFGGPMAVVALMDEEISRKRRWITRTDFNRVFAFCKLLPGPVATQMAIYLGRLRGGSLGGLLAGSLFILPAFFMILILGTAYFKATNLAGWGSVFVGMQAGALAAMIISIVNMAKPFKKLPSAWVVMVLSGGLVLFFPRFEPLIIVTAGLVGTWFFREHELGVQQEAEFQQDKGTSFVSVAGSRTTKVWATQSFYKLGIFGLVFAVIWFLASGKKLFDLFWVCFKAGAFVFGSGLAIVPLLEYEVVQKYQWLTHSEFMDGLALGQVTPGPIVITATFIGLKVAGIVGAVVATFAIFFPAFFNMLFLVPAVLSRMGNHLWLERFSRFAVPSVIGSALAITLKLAFTTITTPELGVLLAAAFGGILYFEAPAWILILVAGLLHGAYGHFIGRH